MTSYDISEHEVDAIRTEATILINKVLEESIIILSQQQKSKSHATSNVANNFSQFKNVNRNDKSRITIKTLPSQKNITEISSENISDNSYSYKFIPSTTDTGSEIAQHDCTETNKRPAPKPTPQTISQNNDIRTVLPIPKPRQQKPLCTEQSGDNTSQNIVPRIIACADTDTYSQEQTINQHQKLDSSEFSLDSTAGNENMKEFELISTGEISPLFSKPKFDASSHLLLYTAVTTQSDIDRKNEQYEIVEPLAFGQKEYSYSLQLKKEFDTLQQGDFTKKLDSAKILYDDVNNIQTCEENLQTNFYIGESSTNIIQKSKPQKEDEKSGEDYVLSVEKIALDEESKIKSNGFAVDSSIDKTFTNAESDNKVIRQGSETRNDLLEIETESHKPLEEINKILTEITPHIDKSISAGTAKNDDTIFESTKKEKHTIEQNKTTLVEKKSIKLDLLLDKSEIELSEKSSAPTNSKLCITTTNTGETKVIIPDVLLVERTLEEVKLSLDAAKEELIQVVRDGKSIKQSPSEFEFKNISYIKDNISQYIEQDQERKGDRLTSQINSVLCDIPESQSSQIEAEIDSEIKSECFKTLSLDLSKSFDQQSVTKPGSPISNRWSLQEVDNSSSSDSYFKSGSRPCSSEFVQTFHTSSEYHTALDASICRGSTEYVSAVSTFYSDTSANLGSIDTSDLSETLIVSIGDQNVYIEDDDSSKLDENREILSPEPLENDKQQNCMKRSQEMIFTKDKVLIESAIPTPSKTEHFEFTSDMMQFSDEKKITPSLNEASILSTSSISTVDTIVNNLEALIGSEVSSSLAGFDMLTSVNENHTLVHEYNNQYANSTFLDKKSEIDDINLSTGEPQKRGHKRSESTLVSTDLLLNLLDDESENANPVDNDTNIDSSKMAEDHKESESESDHDPYESEYSRAFKSPSQRKKKKEKRNTEIFDQSPEHPITCVSPLITQTIIEDIVTEETESHIIEEGRRPSQNMQDYSNIPDITVTEEIIKYVEEKNEFSDSSLYKVKTQDELNKVEDSPIQRTSEQASSFSNEQFNELVQQQYKQKLADLHEYHECESRAPDSPDSFEMVDQPDLSDEFVIIEEVAKEASELDLEGKSIKITSNKVIQKHDEEVEKILIKSAPAATHLVSQILRDDLNFDFEESPPHSSGQTERETPEIGTNKKWVEIQLSDHAAQLRYPYELERGVLEDIKEEDAEFEVGSSRISSFKDSFSSTPDYDVLAGKKYFSKTEHDEISMNSLQEFESLEQAISLENRRIYQGSIDSNNGSFTKKYMIKNAAGDDISLSSLKEFEGLENACIEAHLIEIKAKEEAALLLSRSDESNNSNNGNEKSQVIVSTSVKAIATQSTPKDKIETVLISKLEECEETNCYPIHKAIDKIECQADIIKRKIDNFVSEQGSAYNLDVNKSIEIVTCIIDSFDISKDLKKKSDADSLDPASVSTHEDESVDSQVQITSFPNPKTVSINQTEVEHFVSMGTTTTLSTTTTYTTFSNTTKMPTEFSNDSLNLCAEQIEGSSVMTDSIDSCASITLLDDSSGAESKQPLLQPIHIEDLSSDEFVTDESSILVKNEEQSVNEVHTKPV